MSGRQPADDRSLSTTAYWRVLDALGEHGSKVKANGVSATAQCPAHDDHNPSLRLRRIDGQALLHCHAGCGTADVLAALDLTLGALYDEPTGARYDYTDRAGTVLRTVHRSPDKRFRQSGHTKGTAPLYRLPAVVQAVAAGQPVYLVEGEKDVHALESLGAVATTSPMGASNWAKVDPAPLTGAHVVVVGDQDETGKTYAAAAVDTLHDLAASVRLARPKVGNDAADHVAAGYDLDDLEPAELPPETTDHSVSDGARELILTAASAIKPRRVRWSWADRIALGTLALLAGPEGLGKSTLAYWVAARITRGELPGEDEGHPRGVLVCATEDSWEHTIVPRLLAAGADLPRVFRVEVRTAYDVHVGLSLPRDLVAVENAARQVDAALLILDPLMSRLDSNLDTHRDGEVRRALEPLAALADRARMAVLGLIHHNKSGSTDPLQVVMASKAFTAVARSVHSVIRDPDDDTDTRRLFGTPKNNLGRTDQPTLAFTVASHAVDTDDGTAWTGRVEWAGEVAGTIRDAMSRSNDGDRTATAEAGDWLSDYLASRGGEASSADAKKEGAAAGHSQDCLKRAKRRLGITDRSEGFPRRTLWKLPPVAVAAPIGAPVGAPVGAHH
ncbi:MAG: AAA family ATPase [Nocardioidaceae bacterium]|nr:AAA family ATPase [Nocardioidaceae bacterium]